MDTLTYGRPPASYRRATSRRRWVIVALAGLAAATVAAVRWVPRGHECVLLNADMCRSHLYGIGLSILLYQQDHGGRYPDTLDPLLADDPADAAMFVCPGSGDTPAPPGGRLSPGHCSYVYLGRGLTVATATAATLVAYDAHPSHAEGVNLLYGDGHVVRVSCDQALATITAARSAGRGNP